VEGVIHGHLETVLCEILCSLAKIWTEVYDSGECEYIIKGLTLWAA
jgi:hypothetical protein